MTPEVKILIEGYAKEIKDGWVASSTVALVESNGKKIIVDPGCNRSKLLEELSKNNLKTRDIDFVLLTHNHIDHILLTAIFENAKVLDDSEIYDGDKESDHGGKIPGTDLEIISTPGHDQFHSSLVVPTDDGTFVIAGDVFWWTDNEKVDLTRDGLLSHNDPYVKNLDELETSRKKILSLADYVIPGHGKMFKVEK